MQVEPRRAAGRSSSGSWPPSRTGDLQGLLDVLAPDVVLVADGGGVVAAARRPIVGARPGGGLPRRGCPAVAPDCGGRHRLAQRRARRAGSIIGGELDTAVSLVVEDGRITRIYAIRNPHKLARLDEEATLSH